MVDKVLRHMSLSQCDLGVYKQALGQSKNTKTKKEHRIIVGLKNKSYDSWSLKWKFERFLGYIHIEMLSVDPLDIKDYSNMEIPIILGLF